ncbi:MAG TPA: 6-phosphofructokinase [Bacteroidales bacterium]|nr:6-phosphofructokinase [Bacteroidales bacterium]HQH18318.1 6-phosphofructokinase [Bacteroidales bacterium]HQI45076.1 6-phosphofructokinase [Bacteroidales bacterium]
MKPKNKIFSGKTLAILTGGGDTPALNSSIESVRNRASMLGFKVYGIRKGWKGLLGEGDVIDLTNHPYDGWYGGTALLSSRTNPFPTKKNPENRVPQILNNLKRYHIDVLVSIGGDDTNGAAKRLYETEGIPVIGFPKTIDNDLRTHTMHSYNGKEVEAVLCPGFPSAVQGIVDFSNRMRTTCESHQRICVLEVMGRDAGWLTGGAYYGGAEISLIPEIEITKERKEVFFEKVKEAYLNSPKKAIVVAVSEGVRWYDEAKGKVDVVYASSETDEYGHPRFGGISGVIASEITKKLGIEARAQITGYYPRSGQCQEYDRKLTVTLADKVADLLLREEYGQMPVITKIVKQIELEEYNTSSIDMGSIGNRPLQDIYYNLDQYNFTSAYDDFLSNIIDKPEINEFKYDFPIVLPK